MKGPPKVMTVMHPPHPCGYMVTFQVLGSWLGPLVVLSGFWQKMPIYENEFA